MTTANYTEDTIDALYDAWANGLDFVESEGIMFVCFPDGIWTMPKDIVNLTEDNRVDFVLKPSKPWGYAAE